MNVIATLTPEKYAENLSAKYRRKYDESTRLRMLQAELAFQREMAQDSKDYTGFPKRSREWRNAVATRLEQIITRLDK